MRFQITDSRREEFFKHRRVGKGPLRPYGKPKVAHSIALKSGEVYVLVRRPTCEEATRVAKDLLNITDAAWARMLTQYVARKQRLDEKVRRARVAFEKRQLKKAARVGERAKKALGRLEKA